MQEKYNVTGMTCAACQARVQKSVSNLTGVQECNVNLLKNSMVVTYGLPIATYMKEYPGTPSHEATSGDRCHHCRYGRSGRV